MHRVSVTIPAAGVTEALPFQGRTVVVESGSADDAATVSTLHLGIGGDGVPLRNGSTIRLPYKGPLYITGRGDAGTLYLTYGPKCFDLKICCPASSSAWNRLAMLVEDDTTTARRIRYYDTAFALQSSNNLASSGNGLWQGGFYGNDTHQEFYITGKANNHRVYSVPYNSGVETNLATGFAPDSTTTIGVHECIYDPNNDLVLGCDARAEDVWSVTRDGVTFVGNHIECTAVVGIFQPQHLQLRFVQDDVALSANRAKYLTGNGPAATLVGGDLLISDGVVENNFFISQSAIDRTGGRFWVANFGQGLGGAVLIRCYDLGTGVGTTLVNRGVLGADTLRGMVYDPVNDRLLWTQQNTGLYSIDATAGGGVTQHVDFTLGSDEGLGIALITV